MIETITLVDKPLLIGKDQYIVTGKFQVITERDYGADADGNRGTCVTYVDDYNLERLNKNDIELDVHDNVSDDLEVVIDYIESNGL